DAGIIIQDADLAFGCMGCARTNELVRFLLHRRGIPILELTYPRSDEEGVRFVAAIREFLSSLAGGASA
ncbi:MAG TPA: DUF2112 family protein, partial [Methanoregulaceae archaeon]|nr:DUF2112 family protein [Methanoregulaceae archaeon]